MKQAMMYENREAQFLALRFLPDPNMQGSLYGHISVKTSCYRVLWKALWA
jgi:hypothetical protein